MSDVFVSYKAEDRKRVKPLVAALEADGYSVWWDEQIGGGAAWRQTIEAELNASTFNPISPGSLYGNRSAPTRRKVRRLYVEDRFPGLIAGAWRTALPFPR